MLVKYLKTLLCLLRGHRTMHKAHWIAKIIYAIKMYLLEEQIILLSKGTIATNHQMKQLKEFALFTTTIYSRWFLSHSAANAPWYSGMTCACTKELLVTRL